MPSRRILVSWIGTTDLLSMAAELDDRQRTRVLEALGVTRELSKQDGPIKTLLKNEPFGEVHLLSNFAAFLNRQFAVWLDKKVTVHSVKLDNPTDYAQIFTAVNETLEKIGDRPGAEWAFFLSPGTPAMAATWILVGKSRHDVAFFQTHDGRAWKTEIPYDIVASFVPDLAKSPDSSLQHLAAKSPSELAGFEQIVGSSRSLRYAIGRAAKAAMRDVPVLILGASGTGKEMVARAIHDASRRKAEEFIAINCAAIPEGLLESELFGHTKNAFTGAVTNREGAFERANGGTIFLDEIGECSSDLQAKLLRVLQPPPGKGPCYREFSRVGESNTRHSDVRLLAATNRDLMDAISAGRFREDLFYRLAVITVKLPPLRERKSDISFLVDALMDEINRDFRSQEPGYQDKIISDAAKRFVRSYDWPGNVRQLRNTLVEAAVMASSDTIGVEEVKAAIADVPGQKSYGVLDQSLGDGFCLQDLLEDIHRQYLERAMAESGGVKTRAAELLGIANYQTLDAQLKRLNVAGKWK